MARKGFWSRLMGNLVGDGSDKPPIPADPPRPENPPTPQASADGDNRVSGSTSQHPSKTGFKTDKVSDVYAQALFELAQQGGNLDAVASEVEQLAALLSANAQLLTLLSGRALGVEDRAGVIDRVFKGQVSSTLYRFLHVLNRKQRLASLPSITASFGKLVASHRGIVEVDAFVAQRLDRAEADRVAASIGRALGKQVVLHQYVDESLIGGIKVRIGDRMIDGSVATKLTRLKHEMVAAGREKARQLIAAEG